MTDLQKEIIAVCVSKLRNRGENGISRILEAAGLEIEQKVENLYKMIEASPQSLWMKLDPKSPQSQWVRLDPYKVGDMIDIEGEDRPRVLIEHSSGVKEFVPVCNSFATDEDFVDTANGSDKFVQPVPRTSESDHSVAPMSKADKLIHGLWNAGKMLNEMSRESGLESGTIVMILDRLGLGIPSVPEQAPPPDAPVDLVVPVESGDPDPKALVVDRTIEEIRHEIPPYRPAQINSALRLIWHGKYDEARTQLADLDSFVDRWDDRIKELRNCRNPGEVNIFIAKYQEKWT